MLDDVISQTRRAAVAERLRLTREALSLNQSEMARLTDITVRAWNNYELDIRRISVDQAIKVCRSTGVSLDWIYRGEMSLLPHKIATALQQPLPQKRRA